MAGRPRLRQSSNVRARLSLDPKSLEQFNRVLKRLKDAARREIVEQALLAGGGVIHDAAEGKAPGPHIEVQIMTGAELKKGWKSAGAQGIISTGIYAVIGPDTAHWYYRFSEYGTKAHSVKRRKRTQKEITARYAQGRGAYRKLKKQYAGRRPAMVFSIDGRLIFARNVRGMAAHPFLRPAVDSQGTAAVIEVGKVMGKEIEKAARG
jgi:HK97 gp10 family phage protein